MNSPCVGRRRLQDVAKYYFSIPMHDFPNNAITAVEFAKRHYLRLAWKKNTSEINSNILASK
jgi:hypothetical protein